MTFRSRCFLLMLATALAFATPAYAYGDPSGGNFLQVVRPAMAMVWGGCLIFYHRVRRLVQRLRRKANQPTSDSLNITEKVPRS